MQRVAVIGAGPAGCIASALLARAGFDVTLIEQHRFPRDKVCGECLSSLGIEALQRAGLDETIRSLRPARLTRGVIASNRHEATLHLPAPMWGLSRMKMDDALLRAARQAGVHVQQPARCEGIHPAKSVQLRIRSLESNVVERFDCDLLLLADGKGALNVERPRPSGDLGLKAHFKGVRDDADAISLFGVRGHYVGLAPIEEDHWNVAMNVPADRLRSARGDFDALFQQLLSENSGLARRMVHATRVSDWLCSPLPRFPVASHWPDHVIPIGNAAAALEPIGGEGMGLAMRSAELAATEIISAMQVGRPVNTTRLQSEMRNLWRRRSWTCRLGAALLSNPFTAPLATRAVEPLSQLALRWVGKTPPDNLTFAASTL